MKKTLLTLALVTASVAAFAQGKVSFGNNSQHYFVLGGTLPGDASIGGGVSDTSANTVSGATGAIPVSPLPSGVTLVAALYAGTASGAEVLQTKIVLNATGFLQAGRMVNNNVILTGVPGGSLAYFRIDVFDNAYASGLLAAAGGSYYGTTGEFTATPGASISYPGLVSGTPANSTWAPANLVINVPEPSTFALAGLGAAAMLIFRRRK